MKRIHVGLMALAAIAGAASAFTTAPKRFATRVYVTQGTGGNSFSYTTVQPSLPVDCLDHPAGRCQISTNISLSTLNSSFVNSFPAENDGNPSSPSYVNYVTTAVRIYK